MSLTTYAAVASGGDRAWLSLSLEARGLNYAQMNWLNTTTAPRAMSRPGTHEKLLELLAIEKPGLVLDVPAGQGALAQQLLRRDFQVVCMDIDAENFKLPGVEFVRADMNQPWPLCSARFDYVVSADGIEHFENPHHAVREIARVLKPCGKVLLSFPNMLNVEQRVRLFHFGFSAHYKPNAPDHFNPLPYFEVHSILVRHRFQVVALTTSRIKKGSWMLFPLVLWIRLWAALTSPQKRARYLLRWLTSTPVLMGEKVILKAQKMG